MEQPVPEQGLCTPAPPSPLSSKVMSEDDVGVVVGEQGSDKPGPSPSKTCEETGPKDESLSSSSSLSPSLKMKTYRLTSNGVMVPEFLEDQGRESNFTDLDMICCDGYIQVHRCLLMGASKLVRDILIEKDIMDTTAISLPDVSVNHLQQVLGLIYGGKTLINGEDEVEVFHLMNMLGFPANDLECRAAREHDVDHVAVVRHIPNDDSSTCTRDSSTGKEGRENVENKDEDVDGKEESLESGEKEGGLLLIPAPSSVAEEEGYGNESESLTEPVDQKSDFEYEPIGSPNDKNYGDDESDSHPHKMTVSSIDDLKENTSQCKNQQVEKTINADAHDVNENAGDAANGQSDLSFDSNKSEGQSNNTSLLSFNSDDIDDDLNFEEACNDLQKQVAMPIATSNVSDDSGCETQLRKRKMNDSETAEEMNSSIETEGVKDLRPNTRANTKKNSKKKKTTPTPKKVTRRMNLRTRSSGGGTNASSATPEKTSEVQSINAPQIEDESSKATVKTRNKSRDSSSGQPGQQFQRRLSNCSKTSEASSSGGFGSRVLVGVRDIDGVKYNIYGLMDPVNGCQSGKTIAIMASMDKTNNQLA